MLWDTIRTRTNIRSLRRYLRKYLQPIKYCLIRKDPRLITRIPSQTHLAMAQEEPISKGISTTRTRTSLPLMTFFRHFFRDKISSRGEDDNKIILRTFKCKCCSFCSWLWFTLFLSYLQRSQCTVLGKPSLIKTLFSPKSMELFSTLKMGFTSWVFSNSWMCLSRPRLSTKTDIDSSASRRYTGPGCSVDLDRSMRDPGVKSSFGCKGLTVFKLLLIW